MLGRKGEDAKPNEDEALVERIDQMMDPRATKTPPVPTSSAAEAPKPADTAQPPPLDIFKEAKTAPIVPGTVTKPTTDKAPTPAKENPSQAGNKEDSEPSPEKAADDETEEAQITEQPIDETNPEIENKETDKAVEDIVAKEGDAVLDAEDKAIERANSAASDKPKKASKFKRILKSKKTWLAVAALLLILFAVPATRYTILGLFIKKQVAVVVMDSKTSTPVSSATVTIAGSSKKTDANGKATVKAKLGQSDLKVSKKYYKTSTKKYFVGFKSIPPTKVNLEATGRQVPITVVNSITNQPVSNADIKILNTAAKTNKDGKATIVLPTNSTDNKATIIAKDYNLKKVSVEVTDQVVKQNTFQITPAGSVYFLSNMSGKIDVVKTSLDGSGRQVVLPGTGKEDGASTSLLVSRDWKYAVLKSRREGARPSLYLIDTSNNKVTLFDGSNSDFELIGWSGNNFVYNLTSNAIPQSQSGHQALKSYDADKQELNQLDQSQVEGNPTSYAYQTLNNFYVVNNVVVYSVQWSGYDETGVGYNLTGKNNAIRGIQSNGQNKKDYQPFAATNVGFIQSVQSGPQTVLFAIYNNESNRSSYYQYSNQSAASVNNIDMGDINKQYPTYLVSPSGDQTFWTELRDGKNTLFIGDANAKNQKQLATLSDYAPYGWFSDKYLLASKNNSQLFVIPSSGFVDNKQPLKVSDYYKPATTFTGYGYGYGGL